MAWIREANRDTLRFAVIETEALWQNGKTLQTCSAKYAKLYVLVGLPQRKQLLSTFTPLLRCCRRSFTWQLLGPRFQLRFQIIKGLIIGSFGDFFHATSHLRYFQEFRHALRS